MIEIVKALASDFFVFFKHSLDFISIADNNELILKK